MLVHTANQKYRLSARGARQTPESFLVERAGNAIAACCRNDFFGGRQTPFEYTPKKVKWGPAPRDLIRTMLSYCLYRSYPSMRGGGGAGPPRRGARGGGGRGY